MPKKLRIAIIGCKNMGQKHLKCLQTYFSDKVKIAGILNSSPESTQKTASELNLSPLEGLETLNRRKVDAAIIATPPENHFQTAKTLLEKKIPLLVEKPFAENAEQCLELIRLAKKNNIPLLVGHTENYNPAVLLLKELLTEPILSVAGIRTSKNGGIKKTHIISELMIHDLAIVESLIKDDWCEIRIDKDSKYRWDEHAIVEIKYSSNTILKLEALRTYDAELKRQMRIIDAKNNIWLIRFLERELYKNDECLCSGGDSLKNELEDFIKVVLREKNPNIDIYDAMKIVHFCNELKDINKNIVSTLA
ncbi:MAG: Gfo/Idh/MocA family oxidoreductase [Alphaproteobacteria bacterium]|nr:Gfo/Idh/MocA family oxidoreductase [Alphaproteobacteria bacterium]